MTPYRLFTFVAATLCSLFLLNGCSFSASSESAFDSSGSSVDSSGSFSDSSGSISDFASSPSKSSSDSSRTRQEKFEGDVADYTAQFVVSSRGDLNTFRTRLSALGERYGVTDWENDLATYTGIGRGLKKAKLAKAQIAAFSESLSGGDPLKRQAIEAGLQK